MDHGAFFRNKTLNVITFLSGQTLLQMPSYVLAINLKLETLF